MKKMVGTLIVLMAVCGLIISPSALSKEKTFVLRYGEGTPVTKKWSLQGTASRVFTEEVAARSNGRIKVEIYDRAQLGSLESLVNQVRQGLIQGTTAADGQFAPYYPNVQIFGLPYLFVDDVVAWDVISSPLAEKIREDMAQKTGMRPVAWYGQGFRHYSNSKRPIKTVADMKGLKIRTMNNPMHMQIVKLLGASPTPISWSEIYSALQTGVVDGQENSLPIFRIPKLEEVQKYIILDGHVYGLMCLVINEKWYQSLPDDLKAVINQSARVAETVQNGLSILQPSRDIDELTAMGLEIYDPPLEVKEEFKALTHQPAVEWLKKKIDPAWVDAILAETAKAEKRHGF